jgi:hypothetical protein
MVARKHLNLGTEFKVIADSATMMCLYLEIQRGKKGMSDTAFTDELQATSACCVQMGQGTKRSEEDGVVETYLGDSWFASVDTCIAMYQRFHQRFIGVVKTAHSRYPKKFLEETMADWPAGSHLVLEATADGVPLLAVGYKYNKR